MHPPHMRLPWSGYGPAPPPIRATGRPQLLRLQLLRRQGLHRPPAAPLRRHGAQPQCAFCARMSRHTSYSAGPFCNDGGCYFFCLTRKKRIPERITFFSNFKRVFPTAYYSFTGWKTGTEFEVTQFYLFPSKGGQSYIWNFSSMWGSITKVSVHWHEKQVHKNIGQKSLKKSNSSNCQNQVRCNPSKV